MSHLIGVATMNEADDLHLRAWLESQEYSNIYSSFRGYIIVLDTGSRTVRTRLFHRDPDHSISMAVAYCRRRYTRTIYSARRWVEEQ
jgi:hypothetical protein